MREPSVQAKSYKSAASAVGEYAAITCFLRYARKKAIVHEKQIVSLAVKESTKPR
ncbi:hypothetical protein [Catalinimonas niigatensis]|uniref:hypothetical protein n=1 Tax=Catalinimonas niigatensis TaxID=1397264 RepID=UPI002666F7A0|nr:hypothetical protein [Catalinimonas niigatensis]WPP49916.1 hypothetical protein PZB72_24920 [Catalinimonas niigatensis]